MTARRGFRVRVVSLVFAALASVGVPAVGASQDATDIDPASILDVPNARAALDAVEARRKRMTAERPEAQEACRQRLLVNSCLADLEEQRRQVESRLKLLEVRAKAVLRDARTAKSLESEAERAEARERSEGDRGDRDEVNRARREARENRAAERSETLPLREAEHAQQGEVQSARERSREAERARRERQREQRAREAPARAAAHAQRLEQHESERREQRERMRERGGASAGDPAR